MQRKRTIFPKAAAFLAGMCLILTLSAAAQEISTSNTSRYVGDGRWDWTVYIRAVPQVLSKIRCVEYKLHPTFPNPVRNVCSLGDPHYPFGLKSNGWGVFEISIKVIFRNSTVRHLRHMLKFEAPPVKDSLPITTDNIAIEVRTGLWRWTVFLKGLDQVLDRIQCVEYTLHPTFPDPVKEVCEQGEGPYAFALTATGWGTFKIQIRLFLKDGRVQKLTHDLTF
jgi:transcription initiation factor IIF auxiliary subunit